MSSLRPVLLMGKAKSISGGMGGHFCAIVPTHVNKENRFVNLMQCWGENGSGELGTGDTKARGLRDLGEQFPLPPALIFRTPIKKPIK